MRIITGKFRGKEIASPPESVELRPTSDKVREAIFDTIRTFIKGRTFLDLYAGSGAMGIEAISEGAKFAAFVEKNTASLRVLKKNIAIFDLKKDVVIVKKDVLSLLRNPDKLLERVKEPFDFIFLDPPFPSMLAGETVRLIADSPFIHSESWIIAEHSASEPLPMEIEGGNPLKKFKEKRYGKVIVSYYGIKSTVE
jgi:16S rRNA (guanine966-N2)-methyltransferase